MSGDVAVWIERARNARRMCKIDYARTCYQKAAYGYAKLSPDMSEELKYEIAQFAQSDPVYVSNIQRISRIVAENPGVLQADLIRGCITGSAGYAAEKAVREIAGYVLYYGEVLGDLVRVKSGRSYKLYPPGQVVPEDPPKDKRRKNPNPLQESETDVVVNKEPDDLVADLHKQATAKKYNDWDSAIDCLRRAKLLMVANPSGYPVKQWLRLPKFLREAGRYNEAMAELNELRESTPAARSILAERASGWRSMTSREAIKMFMHAELAEIYEEMVAVAVAADNEREAMEYQRKSGFHRSEWSRLNSVCNP